MLYLLFYYGTASHNIYIKSIRDETRYISDSRVWSVSVTEWRLERHIKDTKRQRCTRRMMLEQKQ